jgi:O-antigen/teichoic acid export membrane protein
MQLIDLLTTRKRQIDLVMILLGRVVIAAQSLLAVRLSTAMLGPSEVGRLNLVLSLISWFTLLLISPVTNYIFRQTTEWYLQNKLINVFKRFILFLCLICFIAILIVIFIYFTVGIGTSIQLNWLLSLLIGSILFGTLNITIISTLNNLGNRSSYVLFMNLTLWLGLCVALGLLYWGEKQAEYWLTGLLVGQIAIIAPSGVTLLKQLQKHRADNNEIKVSTNVADFSLRSVIIFSYPLIITTGLYWMQTNGYRFVLIGFADAATVGLFTTGITVGLTPLKIFDTVFTEFYQPIFYRDIAFSDIRKKAQAWNRYVSAYFPTIIVMATFIGFGSQFLSRLLVSEAFYSVSWLAFWGVLIQSSLMVYAAYVYFSFALLDTRYLILSNFVGALVAIGGTLLFARWNPMLGTAIALFLGMFITMLITALQMGKRFALQLPWRRLGKAAILSVPIIVGMQILLHIMPEPNFFQSLVSFVMTSIYMLTAQFILAREWMFTKSNV